MLSSLDDDGGDDDGGDSLVNALVVGADGHGNGNDDDDQKLDQLVLLLLLHCCCCRFYYYGFCHQQWSMVMLAHTHTQSTLYSELEYKHKCLSMCRGASERRASPTSLSANEEKAVAADGGGGGDVQQPTVYRVAESSPEKHLLPPLPSHQLRLQLEHPPLELGV